MRLFLILFLISLPVISFSQVYPDNQIVLSAGYMLAQGEDGNETVSGYTVGVTYEKAKFQRRVAFGAEILYLSISDDIQLDSGPKVIEYWSLPVSVYSKVYFSESAIKPFLGVGIGLHFSTATLDNFNQSQSDRGLAIQVPAGLRIYILETLILNVDYKFYYLGSSFLGNNMAHTFNGGIGINF